ncbi:MFS general substrate transporter [Mycena floridula]|nr:MFS general substrate transporter [Mycena floridula]
MATNEKPLQDSVEPPASHEESAAPKRDLRFWLVFVALCCSILVSALDLGGVGTAVPTIVSDLKGQDFSWVISAYALTSASCIPLSGNLAQIFGRRPVALGAIVIFAVGSAVSGSATSMNPLIVGRAVQGAGDGGIQATTAIIVADLVPLKERGLFQGIVGMMWSIGSLAGPLIAGSLAERASWRWIFYMNIPLCALAFTVVFLCLKLRTPQESLRKKLAMIDWLGNALITASTCSIMLGLTWGGTHYAWSSARILVLLIVGVSGMAGAIYYESRWPEKPTIPLLVLANWTSFAGYFATFMQLMVTISVVCEASWFQSVRDASAIMSGIYIIPLVLTVSPGAILQGIIVAKIGRYRVLLFGAWSLSLIGVGLLISMHQSTPIGVIAVYQLIVGIGLGLLYANTFAILAPLPLSESPQAVAFMSFLRVLGQAWGVTIGGVILQNTLPRYLPAAVMSQVPNGESLAYRIIPIISTLPEPLKTEVKQAFLRSMRVIWIVLEGICTVGLLSLFIMKDVPLRNTVDKKWGLSEQKNPVLEAPPVISETIGASPALPVTL